MSPMLLWMVNVEKIFFSEIIFKCLMKGLHKYPNALRNTEYGMAFTN